MPSNISIDVLEDIRSLVQASPETEREREKEKLRLKLAFNMPGAFSLTLMSGW